MDQTKLEKHLNDRPKDPLTMPGLFASLKHFDDYNYHGGRKCLREMLGPVWLQTLAWVQEVTIAGIELITSRPFV